MCADPDSFYQLKTSRLSPTAGVFAAAVFLLATACAPDTPQTLVTVADARLHPARLVDLGVTGDSAGDLLVFDQPLLDADMQTIGSNSGTCIRIRPAHSHQCQWTLSLPGGDITVAGREFDSGTSSISIIGGTGEYAGIRGDMQSTNNNDGTFTQRLRYRLDGMNAEVR